GAQRGETQARLGQTVEESIDVGHLDPHGRERLLAAVRRGGGPALLDEPVERRDAGLDGVEVLEYLLDPMPRRGTVRVPLRRERLLDRVRRIRDGGLLHDTRRTLERVR